MVVVGMLLEFGLAVAFVAYMLPGTCPLAPPCSPGWLTSR